MKKLIVLCAAIILISANAMGQWGYPYASQAISVPIDTSWMGLHGMVRTEEWQEVETLDDGEVVKDTLYQRYDKYGYVIEIVSLRQEEYPSWAYIKYKDGRINEMMYKSWSDSMRIIYRYTPDGCPKEVIYDYFDGTDNDTTFIRCDAQGRITSEHGKLASNVNYIYNAQGLLVKHIYENGDTLHYIYNENGQIIKTIYESGSMVRTRTFVRNQYGDIVDEYVTETDGEKNHHHFDYTYDTHRNWLTCRSGKTVTTRKITYYEP